MISPEATLMDSGSYSDDSVCAGMYIKYTTSNAVIRVAPIPTTAIIFANFFESFLFNSFFQTGLLV